MRLLTILGARPQFIKHAIVQRQFPLFGIEEVLIHTGQHFDVAMSEIFFETLKITPPHYNLNATHLEEMLRGLKASVDFREFEAVLVYGDTTSTLAGALYAKEMGLKLIHIEAGLRSYRMQMPEERHRVIVDRLADLLFAPTHQAMQNLQNEGFGKLKGFGKPFLSGDVMLDSFLHFSQFATPVAGLEGEKDFVLCTLHRQSNVDNPQRLRMLLKGLEQIANTHRVFLPLHPRTKRRIQEFGFSLSPKICVLPPQGYLQTLWLLKHCQCVLSDSGGLQKEAYFAHKKCLVLRECSEWVELVESGACELLGEDDLPQAFERLLTSQMNFSQSLYGEGKSVERILNVLCKDLKG